MSIRKMLTDGLPACEASWSLDDRRRPGRLPEVSPSLLPLIRTEMLPSDPLPQLPIPWPEDRVDDEELQAVRGIMFAVAVALPFWAVVGMSIDYLVD